ncbi:unnamed protein product [Alternaria alternata]|jgi:hypothetical protein
MSAPVDAPKPVEVPEVGTAGTVEPAPAPVVATEPVVAAPVAEEAPKTEEVPKTEGEAAAAAPVEEVKEEKVVEPIYSGALGYKAPGLKNAFRFAKKYFWFGEEPVAADNLREYLRGEKPEVAHPVAAWSSQTGKGLLFFVKHADQKEHPAGVLNLAYATDLAKDGAVAFAFKISGHKHTFEATTAAERDGWFVAVEKAITEAKASKDTIESSEGYKENKEKIGKPTALAGATSSAPKKSMDATPKLAEGETAVAGEPVAARAGSSSSSSSDEEKRKKAAKSKSRSVSRGKRASLFGGLLGKKDKEPKEETDAVKTEPEVKTEEPAAVPAVVPHLDEIPATTPVNANDVTHPAETTTEPTAVVAVPTEEAPKVDEAAAPVTQEKPKPQKRGSIFGSFVEKLKSPTTEKKEHEAGLAATPVKENETIPEASKPLEEAQVAAPVVPETTTATEPVVKPEEVKAVSTPSKEKDHFKFGKFFGSKDRAKSPAPEPKVDAAAPQIADTTVEPVQAVEPVPVAETKVEATPETEAPKQDKRKSFFGNLGRSLSKATGNKAPKDKKEAVSPAPVTEEETAAPVVEEKKEETATPVVGDVPAEASVADASKSANPTVATTA